jgi:uncharacterized delta-60 repeat protein
MSRYRDAKGLGRRLTLAGCAAVVLLLATSALAMAAFGRDGKEVLRFAGTPDKAIAYGKARTLLLGSFFGEGGGLVRLRADGGLDRSFAGTGHLAIAATDIAVDARGRILVVGTVPSPTGGVDPVVTRLRSDGTLDSSFGRGGEVTLDWGRRLDEGSAIALGAEGRILVAGSSANYGFNPRGSHSDIPVATVARLRSDGSLDRSFAGDGRRALPEAWSVVDLASGPRGAIVVETGGETRSELLELRKGGALNTSFGTGGRVLIPSLQPAPGEAFFQALEEVAVLPGGRILLGGTVSRAVEDKLRYRVMVMRLRRDGSVDPTYGAGGYAKAGFRGWAFAGALAVRRGGGVIVACAAQVPAGENSNLAAIAFGPGGSINRSFGHGGKVRMDFGGWELAEGAVIRGDRRLVLAGWSGGEGQARTVLGRVPLTRRAVR